MQPYAMRTDNLNMMEHTVLHQGKMTSQAFKNSTQKIERKKMRNAKF